MPNNNEEEGHAQPEAQQVPTKTTTIDDEAHNKPVLQDAQQQAQPEPFQDEHWRVEASHQAGETKIKRTSLDIDKAHFKQAIHDLQQQELQQAQSAPQNEPSEEQLEQLKDEHWRLELSHQAGEKKIKRTSLDIDKLHFKQAMQEQELQEQELQEQELQEQELQEQELQKQKLQEQELQEQELQEQELQEQELQKHKLQEQKLQAQEPQKAQVNFLQQEQRWAQPAEVHDEQWRLEASHQPGEPKIKRTSLDIDKVHFRQAIHDLQQQDSQQAQSARQNEPSEKSPEPPQDEHWRLELSHQAGDKTIKRTSLDIDKVHFKQAMQELHEQEPQQQEPQQQSPQQQAPQQQSPQQQDPQQQEPQQQDPQQQSLQQQSPQQQELQQSQSAVLRELFHEQPAKIEETPQSKETTNSPPNVDEGQFKHTTEETQQHDSSGQQQSPPELQLEPEAPQKQVKKTMLDFDQGWLKQLMFGAKQLGQHQHTPNQLENTQQDQQLHPLGLTSQEQLSQSDNVQAQEAGPANQDMPSQSQQVPKKVKPPRDDDAEKIRLNMAQSKGHSQLEPGNSKRGLFGFIALALVLVGVICVATQQIVHRNDHPQSDATVSSSKNGTKLPVVPSASETSTAEGAPSATSSASNTAEGAPSATNSASNTAEGAPGVTSDNSSTTEDPASSASKGASPASESSHSASEASELPQAHQAKKAIAVPRRKNLGVVAEDDTSLGQGGTYAPAATKTTTSSRSTKRVRSQLTAPPDLPYLPPYQNKPIYDNIQVSRVASGPCYSLVFHVKDTPDTVTDFYMASLKQNNWQIVPNNASVKTIIARRSSASVSIKILSPTETAGDTKVNLVYSIFGKE